jgi:xanthine dehydrogenase accessory factor
MPVRDEDSEALCACCESGGALCTVTSIQGSWSRRVGAQLAILPDGTVRRSLADGCLESGLAAEAARAPIPLALSTPTDIMFRYEALR